MIGKTKFIGNNRVTRREWLGLAWLGGIGALAAILGQAVIKFLTPIQKENTFGGVFQIGGPDELPEPGRQPVNVAEGRFYLVNTEQGVLALHKVCTHLDCLLSWDDQEAAFICPCHGSQFDRQGACLQGPAARAMDRFIVQWVRPDGVIHSETDLRTGAALPLPFSRPIVSEDVVDASSADEASVDEASIDEASVDEASVGASAGDVEAQQDPSAGWQIQVDTSRIVRL